MASTRQLERAAMGARLISPESARVDPGQFRHSRTAAVVGSHSFCSGVRTPCSGKGPSLTGSQTLVLNCLVWPGNWVTSFQPVEG